MCAPGAGAWPELLRGCSVGPALKPQNAAQVLERILAVDYAFPTSIPVSPECKDLLAHILVADPAQRYTIEDIQAHPWCARASAQAPGHTACLEHCLATCVPT